MNAIIGYTALAAAHRNRKDLLPLLEALTQLPEPVSTHARWAVERLREKTCNEQI